MILTDDHVKLIVDKVSEAKSSAFIGFIGRGTVDSM